jgi:CRP-like cAMP-binding protein
VTPEEIASITLFAPLSHDDLARVAAAAHPVDFAAGDVIVHKGEFACDFYAIRRGAADVSDGDEVIGTLGAGDFFGEIGVVPHPELRWTRRRSASVRATSPVDAIVIVGDEFRRLIEEIPALGEALRATLARRAGLDAA